MGEETPPAAKDSTSVKYNRDGTPCKLVKRSKIWEIFQIVPDDSSKAICGECNSVISRGGGTGKSQCTTNLWKHVENKHRGIFEEASKYKEVVSRAEKVQRHPQNSRAWELFSVDVSDPTVIKCLKCDIEIIRPTENATTDVLWYHIMTEHPRLYDKCVNEAMESVALNRKGKRSSVWTEFTQHPEDVCKVVCNTCDTVVSRGTSKDRLNTTNMRRHLIGNVHIRAARSKGQSLVDRIVSDGDRGMSFIDLDNEIPSKRRRVSLLRDDEDSHTGDMDNNISKVGKPLDAQALLTQRPVDLLHTGLLGYALYEQQKKGICCDFSIVVPCDSSSLSDDKEQRNDNESSEEIKVHRCIASLVSEKLREAVESSENRIILLDFRKIIVQYFVEIAYTGKLDVLKPLEIAEALEVYKLAKRLESETVAAFIQRTHPNAKFQSFQQEFHRLTFIDKSLELSKLPTNTTHYEESENTPFPPEARESLPKINKRKNYIPILNGGDSEIIQKSA